MTEPLWRGPAVALITLFHPDGSIDPAATAEHAARVVSAGIRAVLVNGSTAEASALTDDERPALVAAVRDACPGVPVLAGASGEWSGQAAARIRAAVKAGADGVLVAPPRLGGGDLAEYYARAAEAAGDVPVLAYHYPPVAGGPVPVDRLPELPVRGVKDSSGDPARLGHELSPGWDGEVHVGASALLGHASWLGAAGAIVAAANLVPEDCLAAWDRDAAAQHRVMRAERQAKARPGGLKAAVAARFGTSPFRRLG